MTEDIIESTVEAGASPAEQMPVSPESSLPVEKIESHENGAEQSGEKYDAILSKVAAAAPPASQSTDEAVDLDARSIGETIDEESKIQKLLDLASAKGVAHAVSVARKLNDYYALDRMHDALAGKFYAGLVERGLIEKE